MSHRDDDFTPALADGPALAFADKDWEAMRARNEAPQGRPTKATVVRALADAYIGANRSTMRVMQRSHELEAAAARRWFSSHGECPLHGLVESLHTCRDYDGQVFADGYAPQGIELARKYLIA